MLLAFYGFPAEPALAAGLLNGHELLAEVIRGVAFQDGLQLDQAATLFKPLIHKI